MLCRCLCWLLFISVAAAAPADDSDSYIIIGSDPEVTTPRLKTDNLESATTEPDREAEQTAPADLSSLLDAGRDSIVTLVAGDTRLSVHRAVLADRSPVFAAIFDDNAVEDSSIVITVPDVEGPVLRQLVAYMYTLQAPQLPGMATQLLVASDKYGLSALKAVCEQQVAAQLSVETAAATAVLAVRNNYSSLKQAAVSFIKGHIFHVLVTRGWADAMRSQPEDLIRVVQLLPGSQPETNDDGQTSTTDAPAAGLSSTLPVDDDAVSELWDLSRSEKSKRFIEAAKQGDVEQLRLLLAAGTDVDTRDIGGETALMWTALRGQLDAMRYLLGVGADVNPRNGFRNTPLHWAAMFGHPAGVRLLLASSADLTARNGDGWTPLHTAAYSGHAEAVTALLQAGADLEAEDYEGNTPMDYLRKNHMQRLIEKIRH